LPLDVRDRLGTALAPFRNRDAAFALATFLGRFHSNPDRVLGAFAIDRRALADHTGLELTEARVRGAIRTLEAVGYLERAIASGSRYKPTETGLQRKPIKFTFGADFGPLFIKANSRARKAKGGDPRARRTITPTTSPRPSVSALEASRLNSPKNKSEADKALYLGELRKSSGIPAEPPAPTPLELALQRLGEGVFGKPRVG
jgi:hypothetical protein